MGNSNTVIIVHESLSLNMWHNKTMPTLAVAAICPKAQIIDLALHQFDEQFFWTDVQRAFCEEESSEMAAERKLWDRTTPDGLAKEPW